MTLLEKVQIRLRRDGAQCSVDDKTLQMHLEARN